MRSFLTFLSLFTLIFFLAPLLCLSTPLKTEAPPPAATLPGTLEKDGVPWTAADLILGNLAAEGLQGYHPEALKAAAVAAATRLLIRYGEQGNADGFPALSADGAKAAFGEYWFSQYWPQMQSAVTEVWGEYLTADGAIYGGAAVFPVSWGQTEAGVPCPYDGTSNDFETALSVPLEQFTAVFPDYSASLRIKNAQSGRVESVTSGNTVLSGYDVMKTFGLPSPAFSLTVTATEATFRCKGRGDGKGMSLYGANERAKQGAAYGEILRDFYPDARLQEANRSLGSR